MHGERIGVAFDGFVTTSEAIALAKHAVDAGAQSLWMAEHLGYREAITTCAAFAMTAPGPTLVPTAVSPYLWHRDADRDGAGDARRAGARPRRGRARRRQSAVPAGIRHRSSRSRSARCANSSRRCASSGAPSRCTWTASSSSSPARGSRSSRTPIPIYVAAMGPDMLQADGPHRATASCCRPGSRPSRCASRSRCCAEGAAARKGAIRRRCGAPATSSSARRRTAREAIDAVRDEARLRHAQQVPGAEHQGQRALRSTTKRSSPRSRSRDLKARRRARARRGGRGVRHRRHARALPASGCATSSTPGWTSRCSAWSADAARHVQPSASSACGKVSCSESHLSPTTDDLEHCEGDWP